MNREVPEAGEGAVIEVDGKRPAFRNVGVGRGIGELLVSCDANQGKCCTVLLILCESFLDSGTIGADTEQFRSVHNCRTVVANSNMVSSVVCNQ